MRKGAEYHQLILTELSRTSTENYDNAQMSEDWKMKYYLKILHTHTHKYTHTHRLLFVLQN